MPARTPLALVAALAAALAVAGAASAHGDPSTHALEGDSLYPAVAARPSQPVELQLIGLLREIERRGYPIKVALVGTVDDLTDDPSMLKRPQDYAEYVQTQLGGSRYLRGPLVVITPYGIGLAGRFSRDGDLERVNRDDVAALVGDVRAPHRANGNALAASATQLVRRLARLGGHPLPVHVAPASAVWVAPSRGSVSLPHVPPAALAAVALFLLAWLGYEVRRVRAARRACSP